MKGAGGTNGGIITFFLGIVMFVLGLYLFLKNITIMNSFGMGTTLLSFGSGHHFNITTGYILIPFVFGIGFIFYNSKNFIGWILTIGSLALLVFGMLSSFQFRWQSLSAFDTIIILVLLFGGLGLFIKSLAQSKSTLF
jgi:hypothetical protein